jgi:hypothetical protein
MMVAISSGITTAMVWTITTLAITTVVMLRGVLFEPLILFPYISQEILAEFLSSLNIFRIRAAVYKSAFDNTLLHRDTSPHTRHANT